MLRRIAFVGTHAPRQCGIATFTADLADAIAREVPQTECSVVAVNEPGSRRAYPPRVRLEIEQAEVDSYRRAAHVLNDVSIDVVSIQHEFGIFGGPAGAHLIELMQALDVPIVSTLHTVLARPDTDHRAVLQEVARLSERVVVMSEHGAELLSRAYGVPRAKIDRIPHGIRALAVLPGSKQRLALSGRSVLLTFGLLSPNKGIELVIEALPAIVARHPNLTYVVLGATHPQIRQREGERYRDALMSRARELDVEANTMFVNRFVNEHDLDEYMHSADVYITPYRNEEQVTSGTLAHAVGAGKAIVSTPYAHACELLAEGRGVLAPWSDPPSIARLVAGLLDDAEKRSPLGERAREHGRTMVWPVVARAHLRRLERARRSHTTRRRALERAADTGAPLAVPSNSIAHLRAMTEHVGLHQHATGSTPDPAHGYCLDDNARALLLTTLLRASWADAGALDPLDDRYACFVEGAYDEQTGRFRNMMDRAGTWLAETGSEDSHGRALWALGAVIGRRSELARVNRASSLFARALEATVAFTSPRAWTYALLGISEYVAACRGDRRVDAVREQLARRLLGLLEATETPDWPWFESKATYCNARLPQALIVSGRWLRDPAMASAGLRTLEWLCRVQISREGFFAPIGSNGFYPRDGYKASYDQQPVEASAMVSACLEAERASRDPRWRLDAERAFYWFLGRNVVGESLYDSATGGCRDGLHMGRVNQNQGAESTLSFQLALIEMRRVWAGAPA
jgi:glycosyltransferase involved in cell wall biosynthesis